MTGDPDWPAFIRAHTRPVAPPLVPEIALHTASEFTPIWEATEATLEHAGLEPPFWAFAWAGGQALARYVLDHPEVVAGKHVLDFASGSGLGAIAARMAGARRVTANEIDPVAGAAIGLNAGLAGTEIDILIDDIVGSRKGPWDVVLAGDVCYERALAERVIAWLRDIAADGVPVLMGDPKRTYLPRDGLEALKRYSVRTSRLIEDTDVRNAIVWRVLPSVQNAA